MRASPPPSPASGAEPGWKVLLALISLSLCLLLWLNGLVDSLGRPSVGDALNLHQLELTALAGDLLPPSLREQLIGKNPRAELARELKRQIAASPLPAPAVQRLELALLRRGSEPFVVAGELNELREMVDAPRRPLLEALSEGRRAQPHELERWLQPWQAPTLVAQLSCEQLQAPEDSCPATQGRRRLILQLVGVSLLPLLLLLVGSSLLLRLVWLAWRQRLPAAPPLIGPPLSLVDVTLLVAGGFVVLGEVIVPQLLQRRLTGLVAQLPLDDSLSQGVQVLVLYLALMAAPLLILMWMLKGRPGRPGQGWLQWRWRPWRTTLGPATGLVLMVLPAVSLCGWLIDRFWQDPGGSNPMLELVLSSPDPRALACFALTAIVLAPLFEEALFRGVLLPVVGSRWGGGAAVVISAAVFALAHLSLSELVPLFVLGIGLGWLRWRSGRLGASVLMHAFWNTLTFLNLLVLAG
ncbi:MAG: type II CAAX endopeptidase family protein [Cyanobium sp.]